MKRIIVIITVLISFWGSCQSLDSLYMSPEIEAQFLKKGVSMDAFISDKMKYPSRAVESNQEGEIEISIVVEKNGKVSNIEVVKGVNDLLNQEALRVVGQMKKWNPAKNQGNTVRSRKLITVTFRID